MMSDERFTIHKENMYKEDWYDYPFCIKEDGEVVLETIPLYIAEKVRDKLNEQEQKIQLLEKENEDLREVNKENQLLHEENVKQCERWKNLYELKDAEVTARVDALNKVCEYYTSEVLFKSDVDPNKAVKEVINRILNTEVEM